MSFLKISMASAATTLLSFAPLALAGFNATASDNVAVYWGQNSGGTEESQQRLAYYCADASHNIIPVAFMNGIGTPGVNFANAGNNCTAYAGSTALLDCPQLEEDIKSCQADHGKTILISLGGTTYAEGGFADAASARASADVVWGLFGPDTSYANRPFGDAVVDGFDFDFESATTNLLPFAQRLKANIDADASRKYYLTAAPQCPYPDAAMTDVIDGDVPLDFLMVQFYNNYCSVASFVEGQDQQNPDNGFNLATWDNWAKTTSANPDVKILVGAPGNTGAATAGYAPIEQLAAALEYSKQFSSFGGAMIWDMSQVWSNEGFLSSVFGAL